MTKALIALGSNLGKRQTALRVAIERLGRLPRSRLISVASFRETEPVDAPPGSPRFINSAVAVETELSAEELLSELLRIEREIGRDRASEEIANSPRVIDLDLVLFGQEMRETRALTLPHPRMDRRRFVLEPLAEIAPEAVHPGSGRTMRQMLLALELDKANGDHVIHVFRTIAECRAWRQGMPAAACVPFVPTMGALHEGHASLVREARAMADAADLGIRGAVLASIFVNPTQFGPQEDFAKYPRTLDTDLALLEGAGCEAVFVPADGEIYPETSGTSGRRAEGITIEPGPLGTILEGEIRPGHFRGVCTVVAKLLNITQPTHLLLGQKDYQQQAIVRQMCADLNVPVQVVTCPTVREADGLAMSSRNRYLSAEERSRAIALHEALVWAKTAFDSGQRNARILEEGMRQRVEARGLTVQYAVVADARSLELFARKDSEPVDGAAVLLIAAKLGTTRLIDNMLL